MGFKESALRFLLGGIAVVLSYFASIALPWKALGGIFATFPAVMVVAVLMVGVKQGSQKAAEIAKGSVFGMSGCAVCVLTVLGMLQATGLWWLSMVLGLICWFSSAFLIYKLRHAAKTRAHQRTL
ncbi:conserved hypothetical protein [Paenibacillus curdlanolyticus YK9]|uniref:DUF3147 family protein n=1 Tax=Paenibacillus curdlanolyticus YK9 TaxID=717606 RepID=E0I5F0_9BACL|nr:DUF3147 family protein [Paenibacillus curdlanolyticus]EFM12192.1 conserved hypothetical protein [Paenibacillus curdlanolyticus YK9]